MSDGMSSDLSQSGAFRRDGAILNGKYVIEQLIKAGGMGQVYRGRRLDDDAIVAIKIIKPEFLNNRSALSFFAREAEALRELTRGGGTDAIIQFHDFDAEEGTERKFLVMEYVDGPSLSERMRNKSLNYDEILVLCRRVADGLRVAHAQGIIHRDLSPDNILLSHNQLAAAKIIDLGVARMRDSDTTTFLGFAGKNNFASPEQVGLYGGKAFEKSDTYSLGLVLAAAARGEAMEMAGNLADVVRKRQSVPDLSEFDARLRPLLAPMLQPDPAERWTMADVIAWCDRAGPEGGRPNGASPAAAATQLDPASRQNRSPVTPPAERTGRNWVPLLAGVGVVALLAGLGGGYYFVTSQQETIRPVSPVARPPVIASPGTTSEARVTPPRVEPQPDPAQMAPAQRAEAPPPPLTTPATTQAAPEQRAEPGSPSRPVEVAPPTTLAQPTLVPVPAPEPVPERVPSVVGPSVSPPSASTPSSAAPSAGAPATSAPVATIPPTSAPAVTTPPTSAPVATIPPTSSPAVTTPPTSAPVATIPPTSSPAATTPPASVPVATTAPANNPAIVPQPDPLPTPGPLASLPPQPQPNPEPIQPSPAPEAKPFDPRDRDVITRAQVSLRILGCYLGTADGVDGPQTRNAINNAATRLRLGSPILTQDLLDALEAEAARSAGRRLCPPPAPSPAPTPQVQAVPEVAPAPTPAPVAVAPPTPQPAPAPAATSSPAPRQRPTILP